MKPATSKILIVIFVVWLLLPNSTLVGQHFGAQQPFYNFERINEEDGLSNSIVNDIIQDHLGFIWIATDDGLFRFDGSEFISYRHEQTNNNSIPNNSVQRLFKDSENTIWILTDYGIGKYRHDTDKIERLMPGTGPSDLVYKSNSSIVETPGGQIFVGTFGAGVTGFNNEVNYQLSPLHDKAEIDLSNQLVVHLHYSDDSVLWVGTWNDGLLKYDLKFNSIMPVASESDFTRVYTIIEDGNGAIWVGTDKGLWVTEKSAQGVIPVVSKVTSSWMPDDEVLSLLEDSKGRIWIGTRGHGLIKLQNLGPNYLSSTEVSQFLPSALESSISHRTISQIFQDEHQNIWLGTHNSGVNVFDPEGEVVRSLVSNPNNVNTLSHQSVWGMCEDGNGNYWLGTDGGGVNFLNSQTGKVDRLEPKMFSDGAILCALNDGDGNIWFGTYAGGLNKYNVASGSVDTFAKSLDIRTIHQTEAGEIWIGSNGNGLYLYDKKTNRLISKGNTSTFDVRAIASGENGVLWLGTFGNGLVKYDSKTDSVTNYTWYTESDQTPIALSILNRGGVIWVGSRQQGLLRFNPDTESFERFTEESGLANNTVRSIVEDDYDHIWVSTNVGISCFYLEDQRFQNFGINQGILSGQYNDGSAIHSSNGQLLFGGIHGLVSFYPNELITSNSAPDILITHVSSFGKSSAMDKGQNRISHGLAKEHYEFQFDENIFNIGFNGLEFPSSTGWLYEFKLDNYDKDWNNARSERSATYRNIPPGNYEFVVRTTDEGSSIYGRETVLSITVLAPWWMTWYAYIVYLAIVLGAVYLVLRYNNAQIKLKQKLIYEQKLRHQEHEITQQKLRFFTNFSHELRTPLTLIQEPVNDLLANSKNVENKRLLSLIKRNSNVLIKLVSRLLEFRKIETEKTKLSLGYYDISILALEEAESFSYQADQHGVKLEFAYDKEVYGWVDIEKLQIILNNLLSNAIKYTPAGGLIKFCFKEYSEHVEFTVSDSGDGIDPSEHESIFGLFYQAPNSAGMGGTGIGLALTKNFVELHGGEVLVANPGQGTVFTIKIPIKKQQYANLDYVQFLQPDIISEEASAVNEETNENSNDQIVLVADDNKDIREYISAYVSEKYRVVEAKDGQEAFEKAIELIPDMIIADIMMPNRTGLELCELLKKDPLTSHIPIILLTAKDAESSKVEGYRSGADAYITKPFSKNVLSARIDNLLAQRDHLKQTFASGDWENNSSAKSDGEMKFVQRVEAEILSMIDVQDVTVPKLARELGYSRTSLYRKIKALTDLSVNQFIRMVKLKKAAAILASDDTTVSEVAFQLGFTDLKYFRTYFKERFGMLPSEYQKSHSSAPVSPSKIREALDLD